MATRYHRKANLALVVSHTEGRKVVSEHEEAFILQLRANSLDMPEREYRFGAIAAGGTGKGLRERLQDAGLKDWRFDFAWPARLLAVEIEGMGKRGKPGRHQRIAGFEEDIEKYNEAAVLGWTLLRFTGRMVSDGRALNTLLRWMLSK